MRLGPPSDSWLGVGRSGIGLGQHPLRAPYEIENYNHGNLNNSACDVAERDGAGTAFHPIGEIAQIVLAPLANRFGTVMYSLGHCR